MDGDDEATCDFTVRGLPAHVREGLVILAKAWRMSLNSYIVEQLTLDADTPTLAEWMAERDAFRLEMPVVSEPSQP
ncbi:MAG TPA: hypothetical protein VFU73_12025 [Actinocrinis sp.]|nr:hypothetical protein [Actinocrinis sp.]